MGFRSRTYSMLRTCARPVFLNFTTANSVIKYLTAVLRFLNQVYPGDKIEISKRWSAEVCNNVAVVYRWNGSASRWLWTCAASLASISQPQITTRIHTEPESQTTTGNSVNNQLINQLIPTRKKTLAHLHSGICIWSINKYSCEYWSRSGKWAD